MMIQPTERELELFDKLDAAKTEEERKKIDEELTRYLKERNNAMKDNPLFAQYFEQ